MEIVDRAVTTADIDALSDTLEVDLESCFKAIQADVLAIVSSAQTPEEAIQQIEELLSVGLDVDPISVL